MTNDRLFDTADGYVSVGYDDPEETPGDMGGWFLTISARSKTVEYPIEESVAEEIISDFDLEEQ